MTAPSSGSPAFDVLRDGLASDLSLRSELESALRVNVDRVNPTDPGNRFVVGGAVEWIIAAAAWQVGVLTVPGGHSLRGFDLIALQEAARGLWSVKSQSAARAAAFRISNGLGGGGKGLVDPTVFLSPHLPGLVFVDPRIHQDVKALEKVGKDAVTLPHSAVARHARAKPECVAAIVVPTNTGRGKENPFLGYAQTILTATQFPRLSAVFAAANPTRNSLVEGAIQLQLMRESGALTESQFSALIDRLAEDGPS